ncbi:hypothetical protein M0804_004308 [Polistes exclamans]|nr:hypothetical protein M0804_004308 [Polistes exclamans]
MAVEKLLLTLQVAHAADKKTNVLCLTAIGSPDGKLYKVPQEYYQLKDHAELLKFNALRKVREILKLRHDSKKIWINVTKELKGKYLDVNDNIIIYDYYPEEITEERKPTTTREENKYRDLKNVTDKFVLKKFTGKNVNGKQWLDTFMNECTRLAVADGTEKIEVLKLFLDGSAVDWYSSTLIKNILTSDWSTWENSFCDTYTNKGCIREPYHAQLTNFELENINACQMKCRKLKNHEQQAALLNFTRQQQSKLKPNVLQPPRFTTNFENDFGRISNNQPRHQNYRSSTMLVDAGSTNRPNKNLACRSNNLLTSSNNVA